MVGNRCVNMNTPEFNELLNVAKKDKGKLSADVGIWQDINQTDDIPTLEQLYEDESQTTVNPRLTKVLERDLSSLQSIRKSILNTIEIQLKPLKNLDPSDQNNESLIKIKNQLEEIQDLLNDYDNTENPTAILGYLKSSEILMSTIESKIKEFSAIATGVRPERNVRIELEVISYLKNAVTNFGLIPDIRKELQGNVLSKDTQLTEYEYKDELLEKLDNLTNRLNNANAEVLSIQRPRIASLLAPYSNLQNSEAKEKLEEKFRNENKKEDFGTGKEAINKFNLALESYINDNLAVDEQYLQESYDYFLEKLNRGGADISIFSAYANSAVDINNQLVQIVAKMFDDADLNVHYNLMKYKSMVFKGLEKTTLEGGTPKKQYEGMYHEGSDGNLYLTTEYSPEFYIELSNRRIELHKLIDKYGENSEQVEKYNKEFTKWKKDNIKFGKPINKWKNKNYDKVKDNINYQNIIQLANISDTNTNGVQSNKIELLNNSVVLYQVPNISSTGYEGMTTNIGANIKDQFERLFNANKADITEFGNQNARDIANDKKALSKRRKALEKEMRRRRANNQPFELIQKELNLISVLTNSIGDVKNQVPIFFRGNNDLKTQSYDLLSVYLDDVTMSENYTHKMHIKTAVETVGNLIKDSTFKKTEGLTKKVLTHIVHKGTSEEVKGLDGVQSNVYKAYESMMANRLYGIRTESSGSNRGAQTANTLMGWAGTTMLGLNYLSGTANLIQGKVTNFIESVGGQFFDKENLLNAESSYFADFAGIVSDVGKPLAKSKTNVMIEYFDIQGNFKSYMNAIGEDKRYKALMKSSNLNFFNNMGEHYVHGTLMYAILDNIKVKNKDGQFIDFKGKVVSKDKAMSLSQALTVNNKGKLELNKNVKYTSYGNKTIDVNPKNGMGMTEVKLLIGKLAHDLHGNYNVEMQSKAQRIVVWKMVLMLRKWMIPGFNRRWRGAAHAFKPKEGLTEEQRFYSEALQSFQEGQYTTVLRFLSNTFKEAKYLGLTESFQKNGRQLTTMERANINRAMSELGILTLMFLASAIAYAGLDEWEDEEITPALLYTAFYTRRLYTEMSFYINPMSAFQIIRSPAASASYAEDIILIGEQFISDTYRVIDGEGLERYERTRRKGMTKLWKRTTDVLPIMNQLDRPVEEAVGYLNML